MHFNNVWRFYMQMKRSPGKSGSHFNPYSDLFSPNERHYIVTSTLCWGVMVALLFYLANVIGPFLLFNLYGIPYLVSFFMIAKLIKLNKTLYLLEKLNIT